MTNSSKPQSLKEKMALARNLALELGERTGWSIPDDPEDKLTSWADGLMHKYYFDRCEGRCSLRQMATFDPGAFEESVDRDIARFTQLLETCWPNHVQSTQQQ